MERPSITSLDPDHREVVCRIARRLQRAGHGAWVVGGAVRDLALGRKVHDVDFATPARPEEIESLFETTHAVGRAFGTILVVEHEITVEVTTFRADGAYRDGRHPEEVVFGESLEADAGRRDFTCNAVYLDPLTDEVRDPVGGLEDLRRGMLRCVGSAERRFREDGLRLLRMVRFAAILGFRIEEASFAAARAAADSLEGVSVERIYAEIETVAVNGCAPRALRTLADTGLLLRAVPAIRTLHAKRCNDEEALTLRLEALERFGDRPDLIGVLAILFDPLDRNLEARALESLVELRPPRAVVDGVRKLWRMGREAHDAGAEIAEAWRRRAARIRLIRAPEWESFAAVGRAWSGGEGGGEPQAGLLALAAGMEGKELFPAPFLTSADLAACAIPPGPRWGILLREAEDRQLGGEIASREEALRWLEARAAENPGG